MGGGGVGGVGRPPFLGANFMHFLKSVREEISAKRPFLKKKII